MSASCSGNCDSCGESCSSRSPESLLAPANKLSNIKHVIAVVSGKGGVGKSTVTSMMAVAMNKLGYKTAILDADITGPSIPQAFGLHEPAVGSDDGILPAVTKDGIKIMSINLLLPKETDPVVWRGPVVAGAVKQFCTSPQSLVSMIVTKAVNMAKMMDVPVYGFVENYSYFRCPDCGKTVEIFGKSKLSEIALEYSLPVLARLPIDPDTARLCDEGKMEQVSLDGVMPAAELIAKAK